ncbi:MAG: glycosyltransferase family 2 protein [Anaerolineae bacterium]|nr:glycosyltransferase family 2 protein [Anaerolineae bacterium]
MDLSIVVPVYNEEENIPYLYDQLTQVLEPLGLEYEIICADDGSRDDSFALLKALAERDSRVKVIRFRRNFGQTAGFSAGFDYASGDIVVTIDADLQNDPAGIPALLAKMAEGYDVVSGWRKERQDSLVRKLPSKIANWLISRTTGVQVHDRGCSLRAHRREIVKEMHLYGDLHRFIPDIAAWVGASMAEIPVNHRPRRFGKSKYGLGRTFRVILDLIAVKFMQSYSTSPMRIFGKWGVVMGALGFLLGLWLTVEKLALGHSIGGRPALTLAILLMLMGVQLISIGLLGEMIVRTYYEGQEKPIYTVREIVDLSRNGPDTRSGEA